MPNLYLRPLTLSDKPAVIAISQHTWEGLDYIEQVYNKWMQQPNSCFAGLFSQDELIGFGRGSILPGGYAWLEGLRKNQASPYKGVAAKITAYLLEWFRQQGNVNRVRFSTYFGNAESIAASRRAGFKQVLTYSIKTYPAHSQPVFKLPVQVKRLSRLTKPLQDYILSSDFIKAGRGHFTTDWVTRPCNLTHLQQGFYKAVVYVQNGAIQGAALYQPAKMPDCLSVSFIQASSQQVFNTLHQALCNTARHYGRKYIELVRPLRCQVAKMLSNCGYINWEQEKDYLVFELSKRRLNG